VQCSEWYSLVAFKMQHKSCCINFIWITAVKGSIVHDYGKPSNTKITVVIIALDGSACRAQKLAPSHLSKKW
jgi:hypothetical protein